MAEETIRAFIEDSSDNMKLGAFAPSLHPIGRSLKTTSGTLDGWYTPSGGSEFDNIEIESDDFDSDYDKRLILNMDSLKSSPWARWETKNTMMKPFILELRVAFNSTVGYPDHVDLQISTFSSSSPIWLKFDKGHVFKDQDGNNCGSWSDDTIYTIKYESYEDSSGNDVVKLYINDDLKQTYAIDWENFVSVYFQVNVEVTYLAMYDVWIHGIDHSNSPQYSKTRSLTSWTELDQGIINLQYNRRMDRVSNGSIVFSNPQQKHNNTFSGSVGDEIILVRQDVESPWTYDYLMHGKIERVEFDDNGIYLTFEHLSKTILRSPIDSFTSELADVRISSIDSNTAITCVDEYSNSPSWTNDQFKDKKFIIVDKTSDYPIKQNCVSVSVTGYDGVAKTIVSNRSSHKYLWQWSDYCTLYNTSLSDSTFAFRIKFDFNITRADITRIDLNFYGRTFSADGSASIEIYNDSTSTWESIYTIPTGIYAALKKTHVITANITNYVSTNDELYVRIKSGYFDKMLFFHTSYLMVHMVSATVYNSDALIQRYYTCTTNDSDTLNITGDNFNNDKATVGDQVKVLAFTSDVMDQVLMLAGYDYYFAYFTGIKSTQNTVQATTTGIQLNMQNTNVEQVIKKICERDNYRWWFDKDNNFKWTGTWTDSGITLCEADTAEDSTHVRIIAPPVGKKSKITYSKEELCNRCRIKAPGDTYSDWKEDSTSIQDNGLVQKEIAEPIITDKLILDDMAEKYVAKHKDIHPNATGITIEYNTSIDLGKTVTFDFKNLNETLLVEGIAYRFNPGISRKLLMDLELGEDPITLPPEEKLADRIRDVHDLNERGLGQLHKLFTELLDGHNTESTALRVKGKSGSFLIWYDGTDSHVKTTDGDLLFEGASSNYEFDKPLKRTNEGYIYVKRGNSDWDISSLTHDSNWHELDISSVVSAEAKSVLLAVEINDSTTNRQVALRQNGYTYVEAELRVLVANIANNAHFVIGLDEDKKIEYYVSSGVNQARMKVLGWYE
ncbi:MAG: hypothetical protein JRJ62_01590 [Deltaproteobacteria bacterium]|nr:hypothetical protein [Deltaproteobacteria bacterium]